MQRIIKTFYERCPVCKTYLRVEERENHWAARNDDPVYCPVCGKLLKHTNTMFDIDEYVESLDETIEPYKSDYFKKIQK